MNGITLAVIIVVGIVGLIIIYKTLKPYFLRYDTTMLVCGGLGSGKTLTLTKTAIVLIRRNRLTKYYLYNFFVKIYNYFITAGNKAKKKRNKKLSNKLSTNKITQENYERKFKKYKLTKPLRRKPMLYSNYPIHFKTHLFGAKREWSKQLKASHILLLEEQAEFSVVVIDELPQFINQFNWNEELVQKNVNEYITYFRHYIAGHFLASCQSVDDCVVQIRRKLNQAIWCFDFKKWFFGLFYTIRMCDIILSDQVSTISTTFIEENTRLHFGLFCKKGTYATRCYKNRYKNIYLDYQTGQKFNNIFTNKVLRLQQYESPLDDVRTPQEKQKQWDKGEKIWKN